MRRADAVGVAVAVALIATLTWMLVVPVMCRARNRPRSSCLSNLKQLGLGLKQYSQDFDDQYPWRVGADAASRAWLDVGMLYPNYCSAWKTFLCPTSRDRGFEPQAPLLFTDTKHVISYAYGIDATDPDGPGAWTENARSTVRLLADKKAGTAIGSPGNPAKLANHRDDGRNVLYQDGHVKWKAGVDSLDPDEESPAVGAPGKTSYRRWWSDPPYYGE
jgi:prepilin-type processing-associated H-X9-DG protein